jgi:PAS domain-containing protein
MEGSEIDYHWLVLIGIFHLFTYGSIAYKTERLNKMTFLGRESSEKSFTRWLKIFDTFPEGMAIVKDDGSIMYSNKSLARLLESESQPNVTSNYSTVGVQSDHSLQTKKMLEGVRIRKYEANQNSYEKHLTEETRVSQHSVWDFISKNNDGATYEITTTPPITTFSRQ